MVWSVRLTRYVNIAWKKECRCILYLCSYKETFKKKGNEKRDFTMQPKGTLQNVLSISWLYSSDDDGFLFTHMEIFKDIHEQILSAYVRIIHYPHYQPT